MHEREAESTQWTGLTANIAITQLMERYGGQLYRLGLRFCGNEADAEDDLGRDLCRELGDGGIPPVVREKLRTNIANARSPRR